MKRSFSGRRRNSISGDPVWRLACTVDPRARLERPVEADVATIPHKVILQLLNHPLTDIGLEKFLADAKKIPNA